MNFIVPQKNITDTGECIIVQQEPIFMSVFNKQLYKKYIKGKSRSNEVGKFLLNSYRF